ncbi:helix-turn-helix transcriptional regulator [Vibrio methylphosphonaticus]|uniref:helix-turn-helix transcriptional regulator n=1 Tax=Vibrio methylphosphonaticus TaxID=2946866 RepID=UPI00202A4A37|nr:helix-turn-helix transcriptional regulator [Vibrio methylphosphonaticus]MCL9776277.1 helix-turn-helix transcriptional regulator [Vibrio methylphosphonaticus]
MDENRHLESGISENAPNNSPLADDSKKLINEYSQLLESLYSSSLSTQGFQCFLDKMVQEFHLADIVIYLASKSTTQIYSAWMAGPKVAAVLEHIDKNLGAIDYVIEYVHSNPISRFYTLSHDIGRPPESTRRGALLDAENWFDSHFSDVCGAIIHHDKETIACMFAHRDKDHETFTANEILILDNLMPHIKQAYLLYLQNKRLPTDKGWENTLEHIPQASLLFGSRGELIYCNQQAQKLIERLPGVSIKNERVDFDDINFSRQFIISVLRAVGMAYSEHNSFDSLSYCDQDNNEQCTMVFTPTFAAESSQGSIVFLIDKNHNIQLNPLLLNQLYQLTETEIKVCEYTVRGFNRHEIAEQLSRSPYTIKDHLKSIYNKTGTRKQSELIVTIITTSNLASPPTWG